MYRQRRRERPRSPKRRTSSLDAQSYAVQPRTLNTSDHALRLRQQHNSGRHNTSFPLPPPVQILQPPPLDRATTFPGPQPNHNTLPYTPVSPNTPYPFQPTLMGPPSTRIAPPVQGTHRRLSSTSSSPRASRDNQNFLSNNSDSDVPAKPRSRRETSSNRRRKSKGSSAVGTLAKVGGLAVLLDGIVDVAGAF